METVPQAQASTCGRRATAGRRPALGRGSTPTPMEQFTFFFNFLILKERIFGSLDDGPGLLGEWVYNTPIF
jgi:hypothetical protein